MRLYRPVRNSNSANTAKDKKDKLPHESRLSRSLDIQNVDDAAWKMHVLTKQSMDR